VFDTLLAIEESVGIGEFVEVGSTVGDIPLVPEGHDPYEVTL
jgi:hypothetical protein